MRDLSACYRLMRAGSRYAQEWRRVQKKISFHLPALAFLGSPSQVANRRPRPPPSPATRLLAAGKFPKIPSLWRYDRISISTLLLSNCYCQFLAFISSKTMLKLLFWSVGCFCSCLIS